MFLGGIIMIATGASLCMNYSILDDTLLIPELRNNEGKKIVGIILICIGLLFAVVSVSVSAYYLCVHGNKNTTVIKPDDIKSLSNGSSSSAQSTRRSSSQRPGSETSAKSGSSTGRTNGHGARRKISPSDTAVKRPNEKPSGSQFSQSIPNIHHRSKHKQKSTKLKNKRLVTKTQLEDIKELDTISRKTVEVDHTLDNQIDTPRSQSSDLTSLDTSETSQVPKFYISEHSNIPETSYSEIYDKRDIDYLPLYRNNVDSVETFSSSNTNDDCDQNVPKNKHTQHHSHVTHDNPSLEDDITSTGSESTITKNVIFQSQNLSEPILNNEESQTSSL